MDVPQPDRRVKVLLDVTAVSAPLSGIGRYGLELARRLPGCEGVDAVAYLRGNQVEHSFDPELLPVPAQGGRLRQLIKPLLPYKLLLGPYRRSKARALARELEAYNDHIFHSPNFSMPPVSGPAVVTLHDLSVFHFPEFHPRDRVNYLREQVHHSVERAQHLVCDSLFVRDELMALFELPASRVTAIPLGVDAAFKPHSAQQLAATMARYGLEAGQYLFSLGTLEPRKNLAGLLEAFSQLPVALRRRYPLVIAGACGWNYDALIKQIRRLQDSGELVYLDYVPEQDLPALYAGATAFCYFSFYEGFGLPVLEAMSCGVAVLCANSSALPQLCAGSALQVDPGDIEAIAAALRKGLEDEDWRRQSALAGLERSKIFTWERSCSQLVDVFRELAP